MSFQALVDGFWNPDIWLPPNVTWSDISPNKPNSTITYTNHQHLLIPLPLAVILLAVRYLLERFWFAPIGLSLGIKNAKSKKAPTNSVLEKAYKAKGVIRHKQITGLAKQLDWSDRQVERWLRQRKAQDKPSKVIKFCESSWRWVYYTSAFCYGFVILWDKEWLWDITECYTGYPHHGVTNDIWWYYMFSLAFYWSLMLSQFFDVKRKDFWEMCVHHIATICLLGFSWVCNLHRIGSIVLIVHDCADVFLEAAKLTKYSRYQKLCDAVFLIFTILWIVTRCGIYPFWIIYSTTIEAPKIVPMFPAYYIFNTLLIILLALHLFWTYIILQIARRAVTAGQMDGDIRSSSSDVISGEASHSSTHSNSLSTPKKRTIAK